MPGLPPLDLQPVDAGGCALFFRRIKGMHETLVAGPYITLARAGRAEIEPTVRPIGSGLLSPTHHDASLAAPNIALDRHQRPQPAVLSIRWSDNKPMMR